MTAPALAAQRFLISCFWGAVLGVWYGFLRPLRPRWTTLSDFLFLIGLFWAGLYLGFGVCRGDLRLGYFAGILAGWVVWERTVGMFLRPVFSAFWGIMEKICRMAVLPCKKFFKIAKILLHLGKNGLH